MPVLSDNEDMTDPIVKSMDESQAQIIYLLTLINQPRLTIQIEVCLVYLLKNGDYGKPQPFDFQMLRQSSILSATDRHICYWLAASKMQYEINPTEAKYTARSSPTLHPSREPQSFPALRTAR